MVVLFTYPPFLSLLQKTGRLLASGPRKEGAQDNSAWSWGRVTGRALGCPRSLPRLGFWPLSQPYRARCRRQPLACTESLRLRAQKSALSPRWSTWDGPCPPPAHLFPSPTGLSGLEKGFEFGWVGELRMELGDILGQFFP